MNKVKTKNNAEAAVETLTNLAADGKQCLPELDPEGSAEEYEPDAVPEPDLEGPGASEPDGERKITERDRRDFPRLEKQVHGAIRQAAEAYREIRQRQLWQLIQDENGKQLYQSFEEYCQDRHGHPRQWVTHLTNWLAKTEEMERLGIKDPPHLSVRAAQGLLAGRLKEAGGLRAVLEEAKEDGVPFDRDHLREIVLRRAEFNCRSKEGGSLKPAAETYAEYKADLEMVKELGDGQTSWDVVNRAKTLDGDFSDNLVTLCQQERVLPRTDNLLAVLTGESLRGAVNRLKDVGKEQADIEEKKKLLATRKKQIREMQKEGGLMKLKEEAKALEQELEAKGVLKKKKGQGPIDTAVEVQPQIAEVQETEGQEFEASEVRIKLKTALEHLGEALICAWPDDDGELNRILLASQGCESKLAEITVRVKELLADVEEPEAVPSGND
jgi:hypothetical protein